MKRCRDDRVVLIRVPIIPLLSTPAEHVLFRPFVNPLSGEAPQAGSLLPLGYKRRRPSGASFHLHVTGQPAASPDAEDDHMAEDNPLFLDLDKEGTEQIKVAPRLTRFLREHQRQGLAFMFRCLRGLNEWPECRVIKSEAAQQARGCILADDMGLGKTLQSLAALWTFHQSLSDDEKGRNLILCPASLVGNWAAEIKKWLGEQCACSAVVETVKAKVQDKIKAFKYDRQSQALIISYEGFRVNLELITSIKFSLMILDEAHRLKNQDTQLAKAVSEVDCFQRILLTGTPIQNDLDEFFTLAAVANPTIFADIPVLRAEFAHPIIAGTRPDATEAQQTRAQEKLDLLSNITNRFVLRRANTLLAKVLPDKVISNVFCSLSDTQARIYQHLTSLLHDDRDVRKCALSVVQMLLKVCAHPLLVPMSNPNKSIKELWLNTISSAKLDSNVVEVLERPPILSGAGGSSRGSPNVSSVLDSIRTRRSSVGETTATPNIEDLINMSGKLLFVFKLLESLYKLRQDKIVIVSNYTQTLDLIENWCRNPFRYPTVRLDGTVSISKRHNIVTTFNTSDQGFIFLLSSKAGGCGINLIGANRLILMDPDWNPANDKQALARVWRDGQKKRCYIYRLFCSGTVEEKIFQRQIAKESIGSMVVHTATDSNELKGVLADEILEDLFGFDIQSIPVCETHEVISCSRCDECGLCDQAEDDEFDENDLATWSHSPHLGNTLLLQYDTELMQELQTKLALIRQWKCDRPPVPFTMCCLVKSGQTTGGDEPTTEETCTSDKKRSSSVHDSQSEQSYDVGSAYSDSE